ncbi:MAG: hypothetical protein ACP5PZ_01840 [Bacteroidales bacterium]
MQYVRHAEIDKERWDRTVELAIGGMPYALSWYLDVVSPGWDALIEGDYADIMPVTKKHKYFLNYVIQPPFAQQLGVLSAQSLDSRTISKFCNQLINRYGYVNIQLNYANIQLPATDLFPNYVLDLNRSYDDLRRRFAENHRRNIRKVLQTGQLAEGKDIPIVQIENFVQAHESQQHLLPILRQLTRIACDRNAGRWQVAINNSGQIISANFWLHFRYRHIYLYSVSSQEGKSLRASFFLINEYIRRYAGDTCLIDFEGSRIPGVARFFEGFGARVEYYPVFRYYHPLKLFLRSFMPA